MSLDRHNEPDETPAPPKLVAALRRSQSAPVFVPWTVDEAVLRAARQHLAPSPRPRNWLALWLRWPVAAAACLVLGVTIWQVVKTPERKLAQDINGDGQVDILDALQLAQQVKSGANPGTVADFNQDGAVDARDADTLAAQVVQLEKGGRS